MGDRPAPAPELRRLLESAGYRSLERSGVWLAVRPRDHRAVAIATTGQSPAALEAAFPADAAHRTAYYPRDPGDAARRLAAERGIELLDPSTLGAALGELLLLSGPPPHDEAGGTETLEPPAVVLPEGICAVRPRIRRSEAEALGGVSGLRFTMRWVPCFVAPYRVRSPSAHGGVGSVRDRVVAVNTVVRRGEIWEPADRELTNEIPESGARLAAEIDEAAAQEIARDEIRRHHAVRVEHTEQHGEALVIETRRAFPGPDDIRLGPGAVVYVPYWYGEGTNGRVVLDAVTGLKAPERGAEP